MARRNYFLGKTKEWLEEQLSLAQDDLAAGVTNTAGQEGESQFTNEVAKSPQERIDDLLYSLYRIDPVAYPAADCAPVRRSVGTFLDC